MGGIGGADTHNGGSGSSTGGALGPYPADNARRMPVDSSFAALEAARKKRRDIAARSGRASTFLAGNKAYVNSFLGDV